MPNSENKDATASSEIARNTHNRTRIHLDPTPATGVHTSEPVIIGRTINGDGISARGGAAETSGLGLVVLLLVLLDVLAVALALFVELLVLGLDLGFAVL